MVNQFHSFSLKPIDGTPYCRIYLDDKEILGVTSLKIKLSANANPYIVMTLRVNHPEVKLQEGKVFIREDD